jgi:hypothetical protein
MRFSSFLFIATSCCLLPAVTVTAQTARPAPVERVVASLKELGEVEAYYSLDTVCGTGNVVTDDSGNARDCDARSFSGATLPQADGNGGLKFAGGHSFVRTASFVNVDVPCACFV